MVELEEWVIWWWKYFLEETSPIIPPCRRKNRAAFNVLRELSIFAHGSRRYVSPEMLDGGGGWLWHTVKAVYFLQPTFGFVSQYACNASLSSTYLFGICGSFLISMPRGSSQPFHRFKLFRMESSISKLFLLRSDFCFVYGIFLKIRFLNV